MQIVETLLPWYRGAALLSLPTHHSMLSSKLQALVDDLESGERSDGVKQTAALQKILQVAQTAPWELHGHLNAILRTAYFQTAVRALRIMSYGYGVFCFLCVSLV